MSQNYFQFKQFRINQHRSAMKVSSDAVLFGAWCSFEGDDSVLDVGAGTGILSLMCAQRSEAMITAIEPDQGSFADARDNIEQSCWADRIELEQQTFQHFAALTTKRFSHIISNPPYFSSSLKCADSARTAARHNDTLPFSELAQCASQLLKENGRLSVIIPSSEEQEFMDSALRFFYLQRRTEVRTKIEAMPKRLLLSFCILENENIEKDTITIESDQKGVYSDEFAELTRKFYLKL